MLPGESSCLGGSEYVWQRGVEGILGQVTKLMNEFQFSDLLIDSDYVLFILKA